MEGIPMATERRSGKSRRDGLYVNIIGSDMTAEEVEFAKALDIYKRKHGRPFPTCSEVLAVLKSLGYRRTAAAGELPDAKQATHQ